MVFCGTHKYLPKSHPYRQVTMPFNGKIENRVAPIQMIVEQIVATANEKLIWFSNPRNRTSGKLDSIHKHGIKRCNIMFELPY